MDKLRHEELNDMLFGNKDKKIKSILTKDERDVIWLVYGFGNEGLLGKKLLKSRKRSRIIFLKIFFPSKRWNLSKLPLLIILKRDSLTEYNDNSLPGGGRTPPPYFLYKTHAYHIFLVNRQFSERNRGMKKIEKRMHADKERVLDEVSCIDAAT